MKKNESRKGGAKYQPYGDHDLHTLMHEPWEASDKPYMVHAAFALSNLYDLCAPEDDDDFALDGIWGCMVPQKLLDRMVADLKFDFNDAAANRKPVRIWGKPYSIRKTNAYDHERLHLVFDFPLSDGLYTVTKEGVLNLAGSPMDGMERYQVTKEQSQLNRTYLRQIIKMAEDDENDGWEKLTDMEIAVYCWALFYNKQQQDNFVKFKQDYSDYLYASPSDILRCVNEKGVLMERPTGMYAFSRDKVMRWNKEHGQISYAGEIPPSEADDYWYNVALKTTFKPIDSE